MAPFELTMPTTANQLGTLRRSLGPWLDEAGFSSEGRDDALLAANEAASNAIQHASSSDSFTLRAATAGRMLTLEVMDTGDWDGRISERVDGTSGRGLAIIRQLMESVEVITNPAGTTLCMHQPF